MAKQTVEYQETVKEELTVCDNCGNEVDSDGSRIGGRGARVDICSACIEQWAGEDGTTEYVERVEEWKETTDGARDTMVKNIWLFFGFQLATTVTVGLAAFLVEPTVLLVAMFFFLLSLLYGTVLINPEYYPGT